MFKKKHRQPNPGQVIIPTDYPNPPEPHEIDIAYILASHYQTTVKFIVPVDDYKRKSADIMMLGVEWEIKSPTGDSKSTIRNQFRRASKQSKNIIIDIRRTNLRYKSIEKEVLFQIKERPYLKKVIIVDRSEKVLEVLV
ncbi:MAG: hypothetical protein LBC73_07135 [Oscillospiraceae bacterium]|jgi:hypothetical protein|nr:hypothetical protein [Oscillospiraceae bacterium]